MLRNMAPAPEFTLADDQGTEWSLGSLRAGRPFLLLFFRGGFCPTARRDLMRYENVYDRIRLFGADMAAISVDPPDVLHGLRERLGLSYTLLSDPGMSVGDLYGVYRSDETDEGPQPHSEPAVFILQADRSIAYSQVQTGPKGAADPAELALIFAYMQAHGGKYW